MNPAPDQPDKALRDRIDELESEVTALKEALAREGGWPAGHYYSPVPDQGEIAEHLERPERWNRHPGEIDYRRDDQRALLGEFAKYHPEIPFPENESGDFRYFYDNPWFTHADAVFLHCFLRRFRPRRVIEVGSGFSSAVMLDTFERFFEDAPEVDLIEPYPERLFDRLFESDRSRVTVHERRVQDGDPGMFDRLRDGDLLFIDSSHVIKTGGDLQFLMFEVLPRLRPGVFVQFHDVFHPFEYPREWLEQGRHWNEIYLLRAFLAHNESWRIRFFSHYAQTEFGDLIESTMPLAMRSPGASIYLQRI